MTYQNEAQTWESMQETMQELQEMEAMNYEMGNGVNRTQAVVIRIQLMPSTGPVFGHPRRIIGATGVAQAPLTGKTVVPLREVDPVNGEVSNGMVYAPEIDSNEFEFAFLGKNALKSAGSWLGKQLTRMPQLAQRIRSIKSLVGGKPCPGCERGFAKKIGQLLPRNVQFGFNRDPNTNHWSLNTNFIDRYGRQYGLTGDGQDGNWKANLTGKNPDGSDLINIDANKTGNTWDGQGRYYDNNGNAVNASVKGGNNMFDGSIDGNIAGNNFAASATADGNNFDSYGFLANKNLYTGVAMAKGPNGFQSQGAYQSPYLNANAHLNWNQQEASMLEEVFQEIGI